MGNARLNGKTAAVVFARGTGDAVPFLNARLLAGKPLLHYAIEAAKRSEQVSAVYVSTEDERIAAVAEAAGAGVLLRPEVLSKHETPMDAAVLHAARELQARHPGLARLVCIQADAVFCPSRAIDQAVELLIHEGHDRVIGVLPEFKKLVVWRKAQGKGLDLLLPPPHLRAKNVKHYSEPGVFTALKLYKDGARPSSDKVGHVHLEEKEAFRVDTEYDLHVAERLIAPKRLALRCDGSPKMGMGHVMRLLNIAQHLQSNEEASPAWTARFFVGSDHLEGAKILTERGIDVDVVRSGDVDHWVRRIEAFGPQLVINDLPFVPARYSELLCSLPAKSITLVDSVADIDPKTERLDTVISLLDEKLSLPHSGFHAGPAFAAFHPSILKKMGRPKARPTEPGPISLLIALGTGDPLRLTSRALEALAGAQDAISRLTVVNREEHQDEAFWKLVAKFKRKPEIVTSPSDRLGQLLAKSDAAIVSGGITAYEASALGVPAIVLCQNERELKRMQLFERNGSILLLGRGESVTAAQIERAARRLAKDAALRGKLSDCGLRISDGRGVERVSRLIAGLLGESRTK